MSQRSRRRTRGWVTGPALVLMVFSLAHRASAQPNACSEIRFGLKGFFSVVENQAVATIQVDRVVFSDPTYCPNGAAEATVDYQSSAGTATTGVDYQEVDDTLMFPQVPFSPSTQTQTLTFTVPIFDDALIEGVETVNLAFTGVTGDAYLGAPDSAVLEIDDDDTTPGSIRFASAGFSVGEGDEQAIITVELVGGIPVRPGIASVQFETRDGTANEPRDYGQTSGTLVWDQGVGGPLTFSVPIVDDSQVDGDETVQLVLSNAQGVPLGSPDAAILTIIDNDQARSELRFASASYRSGEGGGLATIAVERLNPTDAAAGVDYSAGPGSATAGVDFEATQGRLSWGAGEGGTRVFEVTILDDNEAEDDESVALSLSNPAGADLGSPATAQLTIQDNDQPTGVGIEEGNDQSGTVGEVLDEPLTVRVLNSDGDAVLGATVLWEVVEGDAELLDGAQTTTDSEGLASNQVRLGTSLGRIVIRATIVGTDESVDFNINAGLGLTDLNLSAVQRPIAGVLDEICAQEDPGGMRETCDALARLSEAERRQALDELNPTEVATQGVLTLDSMTVQIRNLLQRLAALRRAQQRSLELLAFDFRGTRIPAELLASALSQQEDPELQLADLLPESPTGGAASADQAEAATTDDSSPQSEKRLGFFISGLIASGERPDSARETGFDFDTDGLTLGLDYRFTDSFVFGGALGYMSSDSELSGNGGSLDADGFSLSAYCLYFPSERWYLEAIAGYGQNDFESQRVIDFPGNRQVARADPEGDQLSVAVGLGLDSSFGATLLGLFGRVSYIDGEIDPYEERGAPGMQLFIDGQEVDSLLGSTGLELSYAGSMSWGILVPRLRLSYQHEFEDDSRLITARFVDDPQGLTFGVPTEDPDRDYFTGGFGLNAVFAGGISAFISYEEDFDRDDLDIYVITAGLRFELK